MAELILNEAEKSMPFAELPDDAVGKITKKPMFTFEAEKSPDDATPWHIKIAVIAWAAKCVAVSATSASATIWGATSGSEKLGNWKMTLERLDDSPEKETPGDRSLEMEINANQLTPGHRLSTAWALLRSGLSALFLGRLSLTITKNMKITSLKQGNA